MYLRITDEVLLPVSVHTFYYFQRVGNFAALRIYYLKENFFDFCLEGDLVQVCP